MAIKLFLALVFIADGEDETDVLRKPENRTIFEDGEVEIVSKRGRDNKGVDMFFTSSGILLISIS